MVKNLKATFVLICMLALSVFQMYLVMFMMHENHEQVCALNEHCILQSITNPTAAVQSPLVGLLPLLVVLVWIASAWKEPVPAGVEVLPLKLKQILKGIVQRE